MSSTDKINSSTNYPSTTESHPFSIQPPPSHHIHRDSEVLPGAQGGAPAAPNCDASTTNGSRAWMSNNEKQFGTDTDTGGVMAGGQHNSSGDDGVAIHDLERHDAHQGGVAVGGSDDLPQGHANFTDKVIGKTQQIAGKAMHKPELHEKGELREAGGKAAVLGQAQVSHD